MADKKTTGTSGAGRRRNAPGGNAAVARGGQKPGSAPASRGRQKPGNAAKPAGRPAAARRRNKPAAEPRPGRRPWLIVMLAPALVLTLTAGGGATIAYLEERRTNATVRRELAAQVEELQQRTAALAEQNGRLEARQRTGDEALERLSGQLGNLYRQRRSAPDPRLMEARRLLYGVSMQLALEQNVDKALATLPVAAARLAAIPDPALAPVRAALRADIERLRALPRQDLDGTARRLGELARQAEQFPLGLDKTRAAAPAAAVAAPPSESWWRRLGHAVKQELKSLVVVSRADHNAAALLPPERYFLYQNLKLQLEAARLALLFRNGGQFQAAVAGCADWLRDYFDGGDQRVRAAQAALAQAAQLEFPETPPAIDGALQAMDAYLAEEDAP